MTTEPTPLDALGLAVGMLANIREPVERIRSVRALREGLGREDARLRRLMTDGFLELRAEDPPWTWEQIGELIGITAQRAQALAATGIRQHQERQPA